jgi:hypothetical protein
MKLHDLSPNARHLAESSTAWLDSFWDEEAALIRFPSDFSMDEVRTPEVVPPNVRHGVRETGPYVVGLLLRNGSRDHDRAMQSLRQIMQFQFDEPGKVYHGTFYRYPQEAHPGPTPTIWKDYDPNWRQFIGINFALLLDTFADQIDADLIRQMEHAIELAVIGETDRVKATYTNIALMKAALDAWAGNRFDKRDWTDRGHALSDEIAALFQANNTFCEYNSPTYYGVNLSALRAWRRSPSPLLRQRGEMMEAELWRDVARFYHAGLKNLCGPFDRTYGMDMQKYAGKIGLWIWLETGEQAAPYPNIRMPFEHRHDACAGPMVALLGTDIPDDVKPHLHAFQHTRQIERVIEHDRIASAWLGEKLMFGAERGNRTVSNQFRPATIHWRTPDGSIGTLHLVHGSPVDAVANHEGLVITGRAFANESHGSLEIACPDPGSVKLASGTLQLPGLVLALHTNLDRPSLRIGLHSFAIEYRVPASEDWRITLRTMNPSS